MLTACAASPGSPSAPTVQIPRDCEDLARTVPYPAVTRGLNAKLAIAQHRAALGQANGNLVATRDCQAALRERLAGGRR